MSEECSPWVEVYRCQQYSDCREHAVVLEALGIDYHFIHAGDAYLLLVSPRDVAKARAELADYAAENVAHPLWEDSFFPISHGISGVLGYWATLLLIFSLAQHRAFSLNWWYAGRAHALLIREGEWWRTVTALTLHADVPHLLGNLVFGSLFGLFLSQELGSGVTWFGILLTGAIGNFLNARIQAPSHTSIGASTAVFGALGLLVTRQWRRQDRWSLPRLRRWAPLIIGAILLGYLGTAGERTDVLAHLMGMLAGIVLGAVFNAVNAKVPMMTQHQVGLLWGTLLLVVLAWITAFTLF